MTGTIQLRANLDDVRLWMSLNWIRGTVQDIVTAGLLLVAAGHVGSGHASLRSPAAVRPR